MEKISFYEEAHLAVAAVRIFEFRNKKSPSYEDLAELLGVNVEWVSRICAKLREKGIIDINTGPFESTRVIVKDHTVIETLPRETEQGGMADEIKKFQEKSRNALTEKVKAAAEEKKQKEKKLFEELEKKLKAGVNDLPK